MTRERLPMSNAEQLVEALVGVLAYHCAWDEDHRGAMFYLVDRQIVCVPDPGSPEDLTERGHQEASRDQLAATFGLPMLYPDGHPLTKRLRALTGNPDVEASGEWHPALPVA
jgi:hypothetical protein